MKRTILLLLISAPAGAQTVSENGLETANYKYVAVAVENFSADAGSIGLTEDRIRTRVELRLRSAGLTPGDDVTKNSAVLVVIVHVVGRAFTILFRYERKVDFTTGNRRYRYVAATWKSAIMGTHTGNAAYIMDVLDGRMDEADAQNRR